MEYIVLAIPVFFLLIGLELLFGKLKKTSWYRFNDAITNISCGIGQQVLGVFLKVAVFIGYVWIFEHLRLFTIPVNLFTIFILFVGVDFFYYWFHRLAHEISILWGSHIVHHQSEEYNLTVALRQGWVQSAFSWVFYIPLAFMGFDPFVFLAVSAFQTLYQFWIHTRAIGKLPKVVEYIFNTPSHHRVHHGINPKYLDKNHGGTLILFDRMFGTFQEEEEEVVYGITSQAKSWNPLWLNFAYWIDLLKLVSKGRNLKDKWQILTKPPGWKPDYLGGVEKPGEVKPETFQKFDVQIPEKVNYYVLFQYVILIAAASAFLFFESHFGWIVKSVVVLYLIITIVSLGGLLEKKQWAWKMELPRLIFPVIAAILFTRKESFFSSITFTAEIPSFYVIFLILGVISFALISILWINAFRNIFKTPDLSIK
ncbi:MAG: sterol desaturase family protein [Chitinophagaceae bacterium]|nr:MAG: sterol desaturase family protein [Chitinophagaceae bacterium]